MPKCFHKDAGLRYSIIFKGFLKSCVSAAMAHDCRSSNEPVAMTSVCSVEMALMS